MRNIFENKKEKRKRKNRNNLKIILILVLCISIILVVFLLIRTKNDNNVTEETSSNSENIEEQNVIEVILPARKEINDWRLVLVNKENPLPEDFTIELENIDSTKQFDKRAIGELRQMLQDMKSFGISNIWVQSAYRSIEYQKTLYENKINDYLNRGGTMEEAEMLTSEYINRPGESEHNLGLAVDFNNVNNDFENTKAYMWLKENAKDYGFVMRYPEEKAEITGVSYEPWHWRYVGKEHSYKMDELGMCLEEYIEYIEYLETD